MPVRTNALGAAEQASESLSSRYAAGLWAWVPRAAAGVHDNPPRTERTSRAAMPATRTFVPLEQVKLSPSHTWVGVQEKVAPAKSKAAKTKINIGALRYRARGARRPPSSRSQRVCAPG